jgi:hypothetical protein
LRVWWGPAAVGASAAGWLGSWLLLAPAPELPTRLAGILYTSTIAVALLALAAGGWRWHARTGNVRDLARGWGPALLGGVALAVALLCAVPPRLRVQFDETSLVGVSIGMHEQRAAAMATGTLPHGGMPVPVEQMVDKRPPLFAFLVSLLHDAFGRDPAHALWLNGALLALALTVAAGSANARAGPLVGATAPLLLLAVPLTGVVATSAGFELLAALLLGLVLLAALDVVAAPAPPRWATLLGAGLAFAWTRYESLPLLGVILALVVWRTRGRGLRDARLRWALAAVPPLLVPLVALLVHARDPDFYPEAGGRALLAVDHFVTHAPAFVAACLDPRPSSALPGPIAWLALVAAAAWLWRRRTVSFAALLVLAPVVATTVLMLAWFYGDVGEPTALRLFLPVAWLLALAPLLLVALFGRRATLVLLPAALALALWRGDALRTGAAFPDLDVARVCATLDELRARHGAGRVLWIGAAAQYLAMRGASALSARSFQQRRRDVLQLRRQGDVLDVFVLVTPLDAALAPAFGDSADVLRSHAHDVVETTDGAPAITLCRLRW